MARAPKLYNGMAYLAPNESYARKEATMRPPVAVSSSLMRIDHGDHKGRGGWKGVEHVSKWEVMPDRTERLTAEEAYNAILRNASPEDRAWLASREEPEQEQAA